MKSIGTWIAALAVGAAAIAAPAIGGAQGAARCDAAALTCFASGPATSAGESSFLDLVRAGDARPRDHATASDGFAQAAAYSLAMAPASSTAPEMAPAGVGAIDSAMGTEIPNPGVPAWLALPRSIAAPDASIAWIFGIGFLGFVILRRVRAAPDY